MKLLKSTGLALAASVLALSATTGIASAKMAPTVPVEVWSLRNVVSTVQVSPDGKHILVLVNKSKEGENVLEIYDVNDLSKPLRRLNADPMEMISARWVSNNHIFGTAWKEVRKSVKRPEADVRSYKAFSYNFEKNKFSEAQGSFNIENNLPDEPNTVLISTGKVNRGGTGVDPFEGGRPRAYYKYNLDTGSKKLVLKGTIKHSSAFFDNQGNPRFTQGQDSSTNEALTFYRMPGDKEWTEFGKRYDLDEHKNLYRFLGGIESLVGFKHDDPTIAYIIDSRGEDKAALWEYDLKTDSFGKKLYSNPDADVMGIQLHSMSASGNEKLVAARYSGAKRERHWFDMEEKALHENFERKIPSGHSVNITSRSKDGNTMIVSNSGPKDPGSFWLVKNGKMSKIGSRNPLVKADQLSDVEFIKYKARDGKTIPAYVTKPKGPGPHPLVVMPHGGPHVNEVVGYDEWGQLLANAGYMVLQPQYRMSVGWGKDHFDSAYGEHGLAMQDDKDDGAMHLVKQGLVDKDRMAMFGWSYGGYAALVATSRENNIYQCAIAGAAVADPEKVYMKRKGVNSPKALDDWSQRRGMIGINPMDEVSNTNIPLLMVHGDVDARVMYFNYKDYKKAMKEAGKESQAQYLTLKGADHFSSTLMYEHQEKFYTKLLDYLENDCGPDGL